MGAELVGALAWDHDGKLLVTQGFTLRKLIRITTADILAKRAEK